MNGDNVVFEKYIKDIIRVTLFVFNLMYKNAEIYKIRQDKYV
ncbi:hypothetical protein [Paraclostridium sordellii]|nr:hypothetical protein [Paeniclostridium sordellii]